MSQSHEIPFISINKAFFDYLNVLLMAKQLKKKDVPDEVINAWLGKEAETAKNFLRDEKGDTVSFALLSDCDLASDEVMNLLENNFKNGGE